MKLSGVLPAAMTRSRRAVLATVGAGAATGLAGCAGQLSADGAVFEADAAGLPRSVQEDTGYTHHRTDRVTERRTFGRFGLTRTVEVRSVVEEYDLAVDLGFLGVRVQAAVFAVLSTPQVRILGRTFNPVEDMSPVEVAATLQERYDDIDGVEPDGRFTASVASETTPVERFTATARLRGDGDSHPGVEVYLYVSEVVAVGDDLVVGLAAHPRLFGRQQETVERLLASVEHGTA